MAEYDDIAFDAMNNSTTSKTDNIFKESKYKWASTEDFDFEGEKYTSMLESIGGLPSGRSMDKSQYKTSPRLGKVELEDLRSLVEGTSDDPDVGTDKSWLNVYRKDLGLESMEGRPTFEDIESMRMIDTQQWMKGREEMNVKFPNYWKDASNRNPDVNY